MILFTICNEREFFAIDERRELFAMGALNDF
jgi:hypothetical protein